MPPTRRHATLILAALPLALPACATTETLAMSDNADIVRRFIAAWSRLDAKELSGYFAEDGVYHNIPAAPVTGRDNIERFIAGFTRPWTATDWEVVTLVASGDVVVAERIDRTRLGERHVDLPCCGVFEMAGGKIKVWRDYFDMQTYTKGLAG